ncbi:MAG: hypothetical protein ACXVEF_11290 [Polyangiales bacterium]
MKRGLVLMVVVLAGCGADDKSAPAGAGSDPGPTPTPTGDPCVPPVPGCACKAPGTTTECKVYRKSGDYISCSSGTMTCSDAGTWGSCDGAAVTWDGG